MTKSNGTHGPIGFVHTGPLPKVQTYDPWAILREAYDEGHEILHTKDFSEICRPESTSDDTSVTVYGHLSEEQYRRYATGLMANVAARMLEVEQNVQAHRAQSLLNSIYQEAAEKFGFGQDHMLRGHLSPTVNTLTGCVFSPIESSPSSPVTTSTSVQ